MFERIGFGGDGGHRLQLARRLFGRSGQFRLRGLLDDGFGLGLGRLAASPANHCRARLALEAALVDVALRLRGSADLLAKQRDLLIIERSHRVLELDAVSGRLLDELVALDPEFFGEFICPDLCHLVLLVPVFRSAPHLGSRRGSVSSCV